MSAQGNPPQSVEAEEFALGVMLASSDALDHAIDELLVTDFVRPTHRVVFEALVAMRRSGEPVDELTLVQWLTHRKQLKAAGGTSSVLRLAELRGVVANHKAYVREIKDHALLRELVTAGHALAEAGYEADPAAARQDRDEHPVRKALDKATSELIKLRDRVDGRTYAKRSDIGSLIDDWGPRYIREHADPHAALAVPFPPHMQQLNEWTMGQRPGRLVVSSGFTGHGKSWFGLDCSETVMRHGGRVAYFALELPSDEILERLLAMGGINYAHIQQRTAEWDSMHDRINELARDPQLLTVLDGTTTMQRIEAEVIQARVTGRPYRYVVVDTLNLLSLPGRASDRRVEIDKALMQLKNLSIDHGLTVHAQAQLSRDKRRDPMDPPSLADLKESGGIEQTADLVLFVHRFPGVQPHTLSDTGALVVAKGRNIRRRGQIPVAFDAAGLRFREKTGLRVPGTTVGAIA